ncbi:hypothetical protein GW937_00790 [Candidatus Kaiserbacteria bacterium]|nr:hypothetical protein [Candidatus Kaiserbacteria bacterium]NCT01646.1 hypothetical protein [Candidatus Parcubacteria bacterium]
MPDAGSNTGGALGGDVVTLSSFGGGGGGSTNPVCSDLSLTNGMLEWETLRGKDLTITANDVEIFATSDEDRVDAGSFYVGTASSVEYLLTVNRFRSSDTCTVTSGFIGGMGGDFPLAVGRVLGEQVSAVPYGAPAAGAGGTSPIEISRVQALPSIVLRNLLQVARNG